MKDAKKGITDNFLQKKTIRKWIKTIHSYCSYNPKSDDLNVIGAKEVIKYFKICIKKEEFNNFEKGTFKRLRGNIDNKNCIAALLNLKILCFNEKYNGSLTLYLNKEVNRLLKEIDDLESELTEEEENYSENLQDRENASTDDDLEELELKDNIKAKERVHYLDNLSQDDLGHKNRLKRFRPISPIASGLKVEIDKSKTP